MSTKIANRNAGWYAGRKYEFEGSNLSGRIETFHRPEGTFQVYVIKSYFTEMAYHYEGQWFVNSGKFSQSTSRHMTELNLSGDYVGKDQKETKDFLFNFITNREKILENIRLKASLIANNVQQVNKVKI